MSNLIENAKNEVFETESDSESHDETISNQRVIIFDRVTVSLSIIKTSQETSIFRRSTRNKNIFDEFFARINDSWNKRLESDEYQDADFIRVFKSKKNSESIAKIFEFAARIRKSKSTAYMISQSFENVMNHFDKKQILESMREKINHHKKKET